jgi:hypothetical protein
MSDIDFDELDKAVNNLVNKDEPAIEPATPSPVGAENKPDQKPRGRFMDVVHHSSEMISKNNEPEKQPEQSAPAPRKVLAPTYNDVITPAKNNTYSSNTPSSGDNAPKGDGPPVVKNDWPDPIDVADATSADKGPDSTAKDEPNSKAPSPLFLPDTKVEKRPLGGFNDDPSKGAETSKESEEENAAEASAPTDSPPPADLPPELGADLVAIEEGGSVTGSDVTPGKNESLESAEDEKISESEPVTKPFNPELSSPREKAAKTAEMSGLLAAGSIPQQYKTAAASHDHDATHPIFFDADQYDTPPNPAAKPHHGKTSVFQWIFIVVGLLLLGATLGAALFVFVSNK